VEIKSAVPILDPSSQSAKQSRLFFIDNIRWVLIALVICHHAAVTYSHVGGWYYFDGPQPPPLTTITFATFETLNQAYFMGILFLLAGYFVPRPFDTKGFLKFTRDRFVRLGVPTLFFMLVIHPFVVYWLLRNFDNPAIPPLARAYLPFLTSGRVIGATGPMWFALALLIFCVLYGVFRLAVKGSAARPSLPGHKEVIELMLLMGACSFLVRITQPIGKSIENMQLAYFSQYIVLFIVGIMAYHGDWLLRIPYSFGIFWFKLALFIGVPACPLIILTSGVLHGDSISLLGGVHWQSAVFCFWEAFFCLGMCLGLIVLFREKFNRPTAFSAWMSQNSFSAYLFHTPLLVAVTLCLKPVDAGPGLKFALATLVAVPLTFAVSGLIRTRIPGLSRLL
jgi:fucose 4-O-acetylase-like acetyltransferase